MPFDSAGVYTPPNGATNAFAGQIIASATWNALFADIASALTKCGQNQLIQAPRIISAVGNITVSTTDRIIIIQASVPIITLPASITKLNPVTIVGGAVGIFSTFNSTLTPNGSEKIDGLTPNPVLQGDFQAITLVPIAFGWIIAG